MAGRGSYNGGSTIIYVNRTFGAAKYQEKKWPKVLKMTALMGKAIRQKRRKLLSQKISSIEKSLEGLKIQKANALSPEDIIQLEERIKMKLLELSEILIEKNDMGVI